MRSYRNANYRLSRFKQSIAIICCRKLFSPLRSTKQWARPECLFVGNAIHPKPSKKNNSECNSNECSRFSFLFATEKCKIYHILCDFHSSRHRNRRFLCNFAAYSERKQARTSTNHHLENKEPKIKTIKSVCALCADVSMDSLGLW